MKSLYWFLIALGIICLIPTVMATNPLQMQVLGGQTLYNTTTPDYTPGCTADPSPYNNCGIQCMTNCYTVGSAFGSNGVDINDNTGDGMSFIDWRPYFTGSAAYGQCSNGGTKYPGHGLLRTTLDLPNLTGGYSNYSVGTLSYTVTMGSNNTQANNICLGVIAYSFYDTGSAAYPLDIITSPANGSVISRSFALPSNGTVDYLALTVGYNGNESDNPDPIFFTVNEWNISTAAAAAAAPNPVPPVCEGTLLNQVIQVNSNQQNRTSFQQATSTCYTFLLHDPPFNLTPTAGNFTNGSVEKAVFSIKLEDTTITDTSTYTFAVDYNNGQQIKQVMTYEKHGLSLTNWVPHWNAYYSRQENGVETCAFTKRVLVSGSITPNPQVEFSYAIRAGSGEIQVDNSSSKLLGTAPSLQWTFDDALLYMNGEYTGGGLGAYFSDTPCGDGWGDFLPQPAEFNQSPMLSVLQPGSQRSQHTLTWEFWNGTRTNIWAATVVDQDTSCTGIELISLTCLDPARIIGFIFSVITFPLSYLLSLFPDINGIRSVAQAVIQAVIDTASVFGAIFLGSGSNFGPGGVLWFLTIFNLSLGLGFYAITGNSWAILGVPYVFLKYLILGAVFFYYFFVWIVPKFAIEMIIKIIPIMIDIAKKVYDTAASALLALIGIIGLI